MASQRSTAKSTAEEVPAKPGVSKNKNKKKVSPFRRFFTTSFDLTWELGTYRAYHLTPAYIHWVTVNSTYVLVCSFFARFSVNTSEYAPTWLNATLGLQALLLCYYAALGSLTVKVMLPWLLAVHTISTALWILLSTSFGVRLATGICALGACMIWTVQTVVAHAMSEGHQCHPTINSIPISIAYFGPFIEGRLLRHISHELYQHFVMHTKRTVYEILPQYLGKEFPNPQLVKVVEALPNTR